MINVDDLADPATGPGTAELGFGARISAGRARWLACDANISRMVMGPEGQPLNIGRTTRVWPAHLRRGVEVRDRHCIFTGCGAPSHWCDVHHVLEWHADDGPTSGRTVRCSASSTTPRPTTASGSCGNPTAPGTPTAPTAPRS